LVRVELLLDDDRNFASGRKLLVTGNDDRRELEVEFLRRQHGRVVLKFQGVDSIWEAEGLVGCELVVPTKDLVPPEEGSFYTFQLKGCSVFDGSEFLGIVSDVLDSGGVEVLKVDRDGEETLIPFAEVYLKKVDLEHRRIDVDLPEGLRDLNK
jgi:16S rRNA processing protein RimM